MTGAILPVEGRFFEDTIDGYFPLVESLRQMLVRQRFAAAWIDMSHAPMMDLPGLAADAPVPLRLDKARAGMIRHLAGFVRLSPDGSTLGCIGRWTWITRGPIDRLPAHIRLAEPAFLRGIGVGPGQVNSGWLGPVAVCPGSDIALCRAQALSAATDAPPWAGALTWGPAPAEGGVVAADGAVPLGGHPLSDYEDTTTSGGAILVRGPLVEADPIARAMRLGT